VRLVIAEVAYAVEEDPDDDQPRPQARELYQLAVSYRQAPHPDLHHAEIARSTIPISAGVAYDAARDPDACRVLLKALIGQRPAVGSRRLGPIPHHRCPRLTADLQPRVFTGQQSNTSVMLGDVALIKLFRRLELGRNLDIEIHAALNKSGNADVARLFGWAEGSWIIDGQTYDADLAMVVEQLKDAVDGWDLALDSLGPSGLSFTADAEALGVALAETHQALRQAFPTADVSGAGIAAGMKQRLAQAATAAPVLLGLHRGPGPLLRRSGRSLLPTQRCTATSPGPDPAHPRRLEDHRLRGRAGQVDGRTAGPGQRLARRGRHAPLLRLRGGQRPRTGQRHLAGRVPARLPARVRRWRPERDRQRDRPGVRGRQGRLRGGLRGTEPTRLGRIPLGPVATLAQADRGSTRSISSSSRSVKKE
jgi:hypothetical protein